jgi:undecaprenyl-diphosphatase
LREIDLLQAVILGLVQGLTEFLPVSSSGHLVLLQKVFGISEGTMIFTTMMHVGTLFSVLVVFWKDIVEIMRRPLSRLPVLIVVATIPTVIIALIFKNAIEEAFAAATFLGVGFLLTGVILWSVELIKPGQKTVEEMSWKHAVLIGVAQGVAIFPAVSRSGSTIAGALFCGLDRKFAARFSFLMSIPAIVGSIVFQFKDIISSSESIDMFPVVVGTLVSAVAGFMAIKMMLNIIAKQRLRIFAYYVFALGILVLADQLFFRIVF